MPIGPTRRRTGLFWGDICLLTCQFQMKILWFLRHVPCIVIHPMRIGHSRESSEPRNRIWQRQWLTSLKSASIPSRLKPISTLRESSCPNQDSNKGKEYEKEAINTLHASAWNYRNSHGISLASVPLQYGSQEEEEGGEVVGEEEKSSAQSNIIGCRSSFPYNVCFS